MNVKNLDEDAHYVLGNQNKLANNAADGYEMIQAAVDGYRCSRKSYKRL